MASSRTRPPTPPLLVLSSHLRSLVAQTLIDKYVFAVMLLVFVSVGLTSVSARTATETAALDDETHWEQADLNAIAIIGAFWVGIHAHFARQVWKAHLTKVAETAEAFAKLFGLPTRGPNGERLFGRSGQGVLARRRKRSRLGSTRTG